jgi:hypothetical protein
MSHKLDSAIAVIGIDIGKNSFHVVGHDKRGAIMLRQKWSRGQVETRLANLPPCLIGMEACVGAAGGLSWRVQLRTLSPGVVCRVNTANNETGRRHGGITGLLARSPGKPHAAHVAAEFASAEHK